MITRGLISVNDIAFGLNVRGASEATEACVRACSEELATMGNRELARNE